MDLELLQIIPHLYLELWLLVAGFISFILMAIDKAAARLKRSRISERTLWTIALLGGFLGIVVGAAVFHHKVSKKSFWPPVFLGTILWIGFLFFLH